VSDAVESAWRAYSMLYDRPDKPARLELEAYVRGLIIKGERNEDQLTVKGLLYLRKRERKGEVT
jgi:hypothetical protein